MTKENKMSKGIVLFLPKAKEQNNEDDIQSQVPWIWAATTCVDPVQFVRDDYEQIVSAIETEEKIPENLPFAVVNGRFVSDIMTFANSIKDINGNVVIAKLVTQGVTFTDPDEKKEYTLNLNKIKEAGGDMKRPVFVNVKGVQHITVWNMTDGFWDVYPVAKMGKLVNDLD